MNLYQHQKTAVAGFDGRYSVDVVGNVYSETTDKGQRKGVLKPYIKNGYFAVNLYKNGKSNHFYIHRLVAAAFIPNPNNYKYINHIDCNKTNNTVHNLEWCTQKHNIHEAMKNGLERHITVKITDLQTSKVTEFYSMRKASAFLGKSCSYVSIERKKRGNVFELSSYRIEVIEN